MREQVWVKTNWKYVKNGSNVHTNDKTMMSVHNNETKTQGISRQTNQELRDKWAESRHNREINHWQDRGQDKALVENKQQNANKETYGEKKTVNSVWGTAEQVMCTEGKFIITTE